VHRPLQVISAGKEGEGFMASNNNLPFNHDDYVEVVIHHLLGTSHSPQTPQGLVLLTQRPTSDAEEGEDTQGLFQTKKKIPTKDVIIEEERTLMMHIGGDSLAALSFLAQGIPSHRPLALDLLWLLLQQQTRPLNLRLVRVAVVALRSQTFIARLFFGDSRTGEVVWQCDSRPSDSLWLAGMSSCPVFVHKHVWSQASVPLRTLLISLGTPYGATKVKSTPAEREEPETIKKLKRELGVAIAEEDYTTAARLRDHPFMKLQSQIEIHKKEGNVVKADKMKRDLDLLIAKHEAQFIEGHD